MTLDEIRQARAAVNAIFDKLEQELRPQGQQEEEATWSPARRLIERELPRREGGAQG